MIHGCPEVKTKQCHTVIHQPNKVHLVDCVSSNQTWHSSSTHNIDIFLYHRCFNYYNTRLVNW